PNEVDVNDIIHRGSDDCRVKLQLIDSDNREILIDRSRGIKKGHHLSWFLDGESQTQRTMRQTQITLLNYFGILENNTQYYNDFLNTTYFSVEAVKAFAGKQSTSKDRMDLISRFLNLEILDRCKSVAKVKANNMEGDLHHIKGQVEFLENKLESIKKTVPIFSHSDNITWLKKNKINVVCLANNHILDYKKNGLKETIELLD
ncbi:MAG: CapA family protein, partial [Nitrosopumilus sp.]